MPKGKSRVRMINIKRNTTQETYHCYLCGYISKGEKSKKLHFKYSHGLKIDKNGTASPLRE